MVYLGFLCAFALGVAIDRLFGRSQSVDDLAQQQAALTAHMFELQQRLTIVEQERELREVLVADAASRLMSAAKRIQTRIRADEEPPPPPNGESPLAMRTRLRGG